MTMSLSPEAQAAVEARRLRERNARGMEALRHLKAAQARARQLKISRANQAAARATVTEHHVPPPVAYHQGNTSRVHEHVRAHRLCTTREIVLATGLSRGQVTKILWRLQTQGQVARELRTDGGGRRAHWYATSEAT